MTENTLKSAYSLALRLTKQRDKWIDSILKILEDPGLDLNLKIESPKHEKALMVVGVFQLVHVMSFISMNRYIEESDIKEFTTEMARIIIDEPYECWKQHCINYEANKQKDFLEELSYFCEDVIMAISGSCSGMVYGQAFIATAYDFLCRNYAITAYHFGDADMCVKMAEVVELIQKDQKENPLRSNPTKMA